jgi:N-acetylglucosaminyldiphosphoundecaprenol N-acetyl-beta-D-mannosaminyltransferase
MLQWQEKSDYEGERHMNGMRANILGCLVDILTMQETLEQIETILNQDQLAHIVTLNAEIAYQARNIDSLRHIINSARIVTPDGIGTVWAARQLGYPVTERVTGIDLLYNLCQRAARRGWPVYLLGAAPGVAEAAAHKLVASNPGLQIAGIHDGYFKEKDIPVLIDHIKACRPAILLVALGAPKQEYFISQYQGELQIPVCVGVGGSFDVVSGNKKRAPKLFIKLNLEWMYRLLAEPSRMKRQLVLPRFAAAVLAQKFSRARA